VEIFEGMPPGSVQTLRENTSTYIICSTAHRGPEQISSVMKSYSSITGFILIQRTIEPLHPEYNIAG
jgi:hypothetical protein